ncbi:uncharacterized protein LOC128550327 isoform X2 [Mercenaria mercenaria]|uniref:uncharacterized protein LOC128550327 isoform X2 n=1 Tax=Mercenaria mercenaria TaxID=6596 RepID=UPI00234EA15F|nr:uncharacterized protein LOC128550327 isoform X2 [Mercenaria mercenaria]
MPNIKTFCRIKPTQETYEEFEASKKTIYLRVPEVLKDFNSNSKGSRACVNHEFNFDHIFMQDASQQDVFDVAALEIVQAFLNGYNGTIFAYGQTGTGKTYTVEGSAKTYHSRGLEPRSLSLIYSELEKRTTEDLSVHISYLEIYQDVGYDLLNPGARTQSYVTPFPKVSVIEGQSGMCVVRNLSNHLAASEDVAQSLLLQGQANRKVAATAIHDRSSRSHAVLTIQLTSKKMDSDTIVRSKLHLVDLAGSERVAKTRVLGHQLTEAKSINLSLHHLETVIVALQEEALAADKANRARTSVGNRKYNFVTRPRSADGIRGPRHVPYRNSLLTMLLRDSLGGNCMTAMIATISLEISNLGESISTCRFAGRVACIANSVSRNEELDEKSLIRKLRKRIAELEAELACLKLTQEDEEVDSRMKLSDEDKLICSQVVKQYLAGKIADPISAGITNPNKFRECLRILKKVVGNPVFGPTSGNEHRRNSLSVTVPTHTPMENGTSPVNGEPDNGETFQRHNVQKLKVDGESDRVKPNNTTQGQRSRSNQNSSLRRNASFEISKTAAPSGERRDVTRDAGAPPSRRQATQAWVDGNAESRVTTASTGERLWTSNSKRDPETLSMILKEQARTPYEQKKAMEIKKLNSKVEKLQSERTEQEQQVIEMKIQVAEKELDLMEKHMRTKLGVSTAQVQDQSSYVKQLISTDADPSLIEQEKLVERQLKKRMDKYDRQLKYIEYRREQLKNQVDGREETAEKIASMQEKYGQFRKRDGSLNTRQVFQMLKSEEKKQSKVKNQIERERIMATAELMELKELATRQKLRELKEAMSSGKPFVQSVNDTSQMNGHGHQVENGAREPVENSFVNESNNDRFTKPSRENTFVVNGDKNEDSQNLNVSANVPNNEFYSKRKSEKDPTSKWESNYSRPTTPSNLAFETSGEKKRTNNEELKVTFDENTQEKENLDNSVMKDKEKRSVLTAEDMLEIQSRRFEKELSNSRTNRKSREKSRLGGDQKTYMPSEYVNGISNADQFDARKMNLSSKNFDSALTSMLGQENNRIYPDNNDYEQFARTSKYRPNPYLESQKTPPSRSKASRDQRSGRERSREARSAERSKQDPDAGRSPVSAKISRYVQGPPSRERQNKPRPRPSSAAGRDHMKPWGWQGGSTQEGIDMSKFLLRNSSFNTLQNEAVQYEDELDTPRRVTALKEKEREKKFMSKAQVERDRVHRIRKARQSAEVIQRSWRRYLAKKKFYMKKMNLTK